MASFDNDAKSCFDRIVMLVASLCAQHEGMSPRACKLFLATLDKVKYHVKTQMGISEASYGTTADHTVHGPGQGGRGSPAIWATISTMIMECLQDQSEGLLQYDTEGKMTGESFTTGFVDDVTLWIGDMLQSISEEETLESLLEATEEAAQCWESLLYSTGANWSCQSVSFTWYMLGSEEITHQVQIMDSATNETIEIEIRQCTDSHKTLGVMETPTGDYKDEGERLLDKAIGFARKTSVIAVSRLEATTLYQSMVQPSMLYSTPAGTLTKQQAAHINSKLTQASLPSMGYNRNSPLEVVYGPKSMGGIGMRDIFAEQGAAKTAAILKHVWADQEIGKPIGCQLQWAQRVAGTGEQILVDTKTRIPQLDGEVGLQTLQEFLRLSDMSISIPEIRPPESRRNWDKVIMSAASQMGASDSTLKRANQCRLYLRVETLADIVEENGKEITQAAMECRGSARIPRSLLSLWPRQTLPGEKYVRAWKEVLKMFCKDGSTTLYEPLGTWIREPTRKRWPALYNFQRGTVVLSREDGSFTEHNVLHQNRRVHKVTTPTGNRGGPWETLVPAACWEINGITTIQLPIPSEIPTKAESDKAKPWQEMIEMLDQWQQDLLTGSKEAHKDQNVMRLKELLQATDGELTVVSDGGCRNQDTVSWLRTRQQAKDYGRHWVVSGGRISRHIGQRPT
jgi:hypothetical protein